MPDDTAPSLALLEKAFARPWDNQLPLHAKVHRGLRFAIENFFEDGQRFFTEKELIDHLKVSQVTVRRAVYDLVRDGLLERRVAKGSFVRKQPARTDDTQASDIAIHLMDWDSSFLSQLLREILGVCGTRQRQAKVFYSRQSGAVISQEGVEWEQADIAAAIIISHPPDLVDELCLHYQNAGKPVVAVDSKGTGDYAHYVGTDNLATTRLGLDHLSALHHENVCLLLNEPEAHHNVVERGECFSVECKTRGLTGHVHHCGTKFWENSYDKAYQAMPAIMALKPRPTAIFAFDDLGAWAVLKWCSNHGIRVPQDISVLGFANDKPSAFTHPALTTIAHPIREIARTAVGLLEGKQSGSKSRLLIPELVVRESTGPAV